MDRWTYKNSNSETGDHSLCRGELPRVVCHAISLQILTNRRKFHRVRRSGPLNFGVLSRRHHAFTLESCSPLASCPIGTTDLNQNDRCDWGDGYNRCENGVRVPARLPRPIQPAGRDAAEIPLQSFGDQISRPCRYHTPQSPPAAYRGSQPSSDSHAFHRSGFTACAEFLELWQNRETARGLAAVSCCRCATPCRHVVPTMPAIS